uniref:TEPSIN adaptor related protein complex 4 accessory protein n=1 Tax=Seriola lalandi dorsalis TaxID=1841481 RepID=A0A3B4WF67_SERLL
MFKARVVCWNESVNSGLLSVSPPLLHRVPTLMKATADDENPCPGYLFQEIGKITHESSGCGQCLLEYLLERLQVESCHVKLKVLKIFVHLCGHGSNHFLTELRRNSTFIQQASVYSGPPDPIHGTALYQKVRNTAQVRRRSYFIIMSITYVCHLGQHTQFLTFSVCRKLSCVFTTAVTHWCPGQVGGGWEETDSGNSSSHNSSQDIAANSRASVGSKSAGTGSQSGASRESSGDLSERVEALQLGDCGQEMALISRLTEGSRVFLSREESQHFIKECSILNCEVVVELLSSKLQDPSNTRALCAVACLMTSDLLSLEQMFGATQRRLHQLSEGPPGPVANKATKILRQFEALMGGPLNTPRQDTANSSHQATTNPPPTSTYSDPLLPTQSADSTNLNHYQPDASPIGVSQLPNHTSSPSSLVLAQRDSSGEPVNDCDEMKHAPIQPEPVRTAEVTLAVEDPDVRNRGSPPPSESQSEQPCLSRLSLFNGMELVSKGRPLSVHNSDNPVHSTPPGTSKTSENAPSESGQPVSAFSFLKF